MDINTLDQDVQYVIIQTKTVIEPYLNFQEKVMRVIAEDSLQLFKKNDEGLHYVKDRYCKESGPCFSFDDHGRAGVSCERFRYQPTGVKICIKL